MSGMAGTVTATRAGRGEMALLLIGTLAAFAVTISLFWIGYLGSDDTLYWAGAGGWLAHIPYLGDTHWALRHTLVIPMAIARAILGDGMPALLLPSLLYAAGFLIVTALWVYRAVGLPAAAAAMALIVTNPQFILLASVANVDIVEDFYIVVAFALLHSAMDQDAARSRRRTFGMLLLVGISTGLAMLSRETSAFAVVAIGLLFLAGYGMPRRWYFLIGFGFAAVVGIEFVYVWWMSGDLFYRAKISIHHDDTTNRWLEQGAAVPLIHPLIDPLTMLLFNHYFGPLTWIGVPLSIWLTRRGEFTVASKRLVVLTSTLGLTWAVIAAGAWTELNLIPRYFLLPALMLSILAGMALARLWRLGRRRLAGSLGALLIGANLFAMWIDNRNYMWGEHELVDIATRVSGSIHTDPQTLRRSSLLLEWKGIAGRVTDTPAGPGDLLYLNPAWSKARPDLSWTIVERHGLPPTIGQLLIARLLPPGTISPSLFDKLGRGHPDVTLYRLP
jgi:4-amino-4-deoxy-L-arabinose transferase-like glycosyltransferase